MKNHLNWQGKNFAFFKNEKCEYFPCHADSDTIKAIKDFNCMFCFCPLYNMEDCGGAFKILSNGQKDCGNCILPHKRKSYGYVMKKLEAASKN